jgi:hypothetical protein
MRIVILGYVIRGPLGGASWHFLQYVLGFKLLGHEVLFLEDSDNYPSCYNPDTYQTTTDPLYGINFIDNLFAKHDIKNNWAYYDEHTNQWFGQSKKNVIDFCKTADVILNIANMNPLRDWWIKIPNRILLDTDPAFTQIRHLEEERTRSFAEHHTHFFSFGENFGKPGCKMPDDGFKWLPTRQPVIIDEWKVAPPQPHGRWTTVMLWDSYKERQYNNLSFGMKSASFDEYFHLPQMTSESFELAIGSSTAPRQKLAEAGWHLSDSSTIAVSPESFQQYFSQSKGEWSIAKQGYIVSNSGWFSERSTGYLATGRPVVVQDTGFSQVIETGKGLFGFNSPEEAIAAIDEINTAYPKHCRYAREIAETYFDSKKVLSDMIMAL